MIIDLQLVDGSVLLTIDLTGLNTYLYSIVDDVTKMQFTKRLTVNDWIGREHAFNALVVQIDLRTLQDQESAFRYANIYGYG